MGSLAGLNKVGCSEILSQQRGETMIKLQIMTISSSSQYQKASDPVILTKSSLKRES